MEKRRRSHGLLRLRVITQDLDCGFRVSATPADLGQAIYQLMQPLTHSGIWPLEQATLCNCSLCLMPTKVLRIQAPILPRVSVPWSNFSYLNSISKVWLQSPEPNTPGKFIVWFRNETTLLVLWQPPYPAGIYTHYKVSIDPPDAIESVLYVEKEGEPPGPAQAAFKGLVPGEFLSPVGSINFSISDDCQCDHRYNRLPFCPVFLPQAEPTIYPYRLCPITKHQHRQRHSTEPCHWDLWM